MTSDPKKGGGGGITGTGVPERAYRSPRELLRFRRRGRVHSSEPGDQQGERDTHETSSSGVAAHHFKIFSS